MARGMPAGWGLVIGIPLVAVGLYTIYSSTSLPQLVGIAFLLLGTFVIITGSYIHYMAPQPKEFSSETVVGKYQPGQLVSKVLMGIGGFLFLVTMYLLYGTFLPYVYPTLSLIGFLWFTLSGLIRYWRNSLTTYYVTTESIQNEYRFLSLRRNRISLDDIAATSRQQSLIESLVGLGTIAVSAGGGNPNITEIYIKDVRNPEAIERDIDQVRNSSLPKNTSPSN